MPETPVDRPRRTVDERPRIINPPKQPFFSWRRLVIVLLIIAGGLFVFVKAYSGDPENGGGSGCSNPAVVASWNPCPGSHVLRQASIGVDFVNGYDGRMTINGIAIPESEMDGAILPGSPQYLQETPAERAEGPGRSTSTSSRSPRAPAR